MNSTDHDQVHLPAPLSRFGGRIVAALALGVTGLFVFNLICGPLAIVLGAAAATAARHRGDRSAWVAALCAVVLGAADLVVFAVLLLGHLHGGSFMWQSS
jgi:hypothetical protein